MPTALAATAGRLASKVFIAPLNPSPPCRISAPPSTLSYGTRTLSKCSATVSLERMPSLCSCLAMFTPGVRPSTTNDLMPARPACESTVAHTTQKPSLSLSDKLPLVMNTFSPLRIHSLVSGSSTAVVRIELLSEPAIGSVMAIAPHLGPPSANRFINRAFCSGVATASTAAPPSPPLGVHR